MNETEAYELKVDQSTKRKRIHDHAEEVNYSNWLGISELKTHYICKTINYYLISKI